MILQELSFPDCQGAVLFAQYHWQLLAQVRTMGAQGGCVSSVPAICGRYASPRTFCLWLNEFGMEYLCIYVFFPQIYNPMKNQIISIPFVVQFISHHWFEIPHLSNFKCNDISHWTLNRFYCYLSLLIC